MMSDTSREAEPKSANALSEERRLTIEALRAENDRLKGALQMCGPSALWPERA